MDLTPGDRVRVAMEKWGGRPHWEFDAMLLGDDEHGTWLGLPVGTHFARPGAEFTAGNLQVTLVPLGRWWVATFHGEGERGTWPDLDGAAVDGDTAVIDQDARMSVAYVMNKMADALVGDLRGGALAVIALAAGA